MIQVPGGNMRPASSVLPGAAQAPSATSFIEPHEEIIAQALMDELLSPRPRPCGYYVLLKTYIRPEELKKIKRDDGTEATIYISQKTAANDEYTSAAALVIEVGKDCYKGERFKDCGPWCKPGDWVLVPRYQGFSFTYRGVALQLLPDDKILGVIDDPAVVRVNTVNDLV